MSHQTLKENRRVSSSSSRPSRYIRNTMFNWRVIISNQKSKLEKLFKWKWERRRPPGRLLKERTLWHFNNLISNYIIKIYIATGISNAMDIMVNCLCLLIIHREANEIYDSVSIILIESINQTIARCCNPKSIHSLNHWQFTYRCEIYFRSLRFVWLNNSIPGSSATSLRSSHFLINNFFLSLGRLDTSQRRAALNIWNNFDCTKTQTKAHRVLCSFRLMLLLLLIQLIPLLMTESERQMKSSPCIWVA